MSKSKQTHQPKLIFAGFVILAAIVALFVFSKLGSPSADVVTLSQPANSLQVCPNRSSVPSNVPSTQVINGAQGKLTSTQVFTSKAGTAYRIGVGCGEQTDRIKVFVGYDVKIYGWLDSGNTVVIVYIQPVIAASSSPSPSPSATPAPVTGTFNGTLKKVEVGIPLPGSYTLDPIIGNKLTAKPNRIIPDPNYSQVAGQLSQYAGLDVIVTGKATYENLEGGYWKITATNVSLVAADNNETSCLPVNNTIPYFGKVTVSGGKYKITTQYIDWKASAKTLEIVPTNPVVNTELAASLQASVNDNFTVYGEPDGDTKVKLHSGKSFNNGITPVAVSGVVQKVTTHPYGTIPVTHRIRTSAGKNYYITNWNATSIRGQYNLIKLLEGKEVTLVTFTSSPIIPDPGTANDFYARTIFNVTPKDAVTITGKVLEAKTITTVPWKYTVDAGNGLLVRVNGGEAWNTYLATQVNKNVSVTGNFSFIFNNLNTCNQIGIQVMATTQAPPQVVSPSSSPSPSPSIAPPTLPPSPSLLPSPVASPPVNNINPLNISLTLQASKTQARRRQFLQLTYRYYNPSNQTARNVVIEQPLPGQLEAENGATVTINIGDLPPGEGTKTVNVRYK